jgi:hypothetical protein
LVASSAQSLSFSVRAEEDVEDRGLAGEMFEAHRLTATDPRLVSSLQNRLAVEAPQKRHFRPAWQK